MDVSVYSRFLSINVHRYGVRVSSPIAFYGTKKVFEAFALFWWAHGKIRFTVNLGNRLVEFIGGRFYWC